MEKSYLRYENAWSAGIISSSRAKICVDSLTGDVVTGAGREVVKWDLGRGVASARYLRASESGARGEVVAVATPDASAARETGLHLGLAAAYGNGLIRVWRGRDGEDHNDYAGHRGAVETLRWCPNAALLASGGANGDIFVWDVVARRARAILRGHTKATTDITWLTTRFLLSTGREAQLKLWDLEARDCIQTISVHDPLLTLDSSFDSGKEEHRVATAGTDRELRCFAFADETLTPTGTLKRGRAEACTQICFSSASSSSSLQTKYRLLLGALTKSCVELYGLTNEEDALRRAKRRTKRRREKQGDDASLSLAVQLSDEFLLLATIFTEHEPRSFVFLKCNEEKTNLAVSTKANSIETHRVLLMNDDEKNESSRIRILETSGHRSAVRSVDANGEGTAVAAATSGSVKVWSTLEAHTLLRSFSTGAKRTKALCIKFVPPQCAHLVVAADDGSVRVLDLASGRAVVELRGAQESKQSVWALDIIQSGQHQAYLCAGGADKMVRTWRFRENAGDDKSENEWHRGRSLDADDEILCLKYFQGDTKTSLLAIATLDASIKIVKSPSLQFMLSLYGHSLGVLCLDAPNDMALVATAGADKSLKFWGLDFGDLRRSVLAHTAAVTTLVFVPDTHYLFTGGKDALIKMWDADRQEPLIQLLRNGHVSEVWSLSVGINGTLFSAGADRSIIKWQRTDEPVFASEEREALLEQQLDDDDQAAGERAPRVFDPFLDAAVGESVLEPALNTHHSAGTHTAADRLAEALDLATDERTSIAEHSQKTANPLLLGLSPEAYIVNRLNTIPTADLERAVLLLPIHQVAQLLDFIDLHLASPALKNGGRTKDLDLEICARAVNFAVAIHHRAVAAHAPLTETLTSLRHSLRTNLDRHRDLFGANLAAIRVASLDGTLTLTSSS